MKTFYSSKQKTYTGQELSSLFAYKNFSIQGDSAVVFCGPCYVDLNDLVDQEDVKLKAYIKSDEMVHLICEKFNLDLPAGVLRQRLYIALIKDVLEKLKPGLNIVRSGDDLFIEHKKLTVSIATLSPVSTLIHIGLNISSKNTPVKTIGLKDLSINTNKFVKTLLLAIAQEEDSLEMARSKVRGVL